MATSIMQHVAEGTDDALGRPDVLSIMSYLVEKGEK